jgi:hypothetical protein
MSLNETVRNPRVQLTLVAVISLVAGAVVSNRVTVQKLEQKYADISEREIAEAKAFYAALKEKPATPAEALAARHPGMVVESSPLLDDAVEAIKSYSGEEDRDLAAVSLTEVQETVVATNVFTNNSDWNHIQELAKRDTSRPYLINEEEWQAAEPGFDQIQLTYYAGDNVLSDDRDEVVDNIEKVVGEENLGRFGEGTGDENVMFIRNEFFKSDYEVTRSEGKYVDEVLGLSHSDDDWTPRGGVRKFRLQDE